MITITAQSRKNIIKFGEIEISVPQYRDGSFEPQVVKKRQKDVSTIEDKIISMYAKGMTTRQISETIEDSPILQFRCSIIAEHLKMLK